MHYVASMRMIPAAAAALLLSAGLAAQEPDAFAPSACESGRITRVVIDNHSIFDTSDPDLDHRLDWAYRLANRLHFRTRSSVIRRELVFDEGDCYDPALLEESERLLRALGFLAEADIHGVRQEDGGYHVIVDTQDEWSTKAEVQADGGGLEGGEIQEANLLGTGQRLELFYRDRRLAQSYGLAYHTPQMFGTRWDFGLRAGSTRAGTFFEQTVAFPFVGEQGRWAAVQAFRRDDRLFDLVAAEAPAGMDELPEPEVHLLLPMREKGMDVGLVKRIGRIGSLSVIGAALSFQELSYPGGRGRSVLVYGDEYNDTTAIVADFVDPVWSELSETQNIRAFLLLGHRSVEWTERDRLDAMRASQDVRVGAEISLALGRSLPGLELADDLFGTLTLFSGMTFGESVLLINDLRVDARRDFDAPIEAAEWRDVLGEGRMLAYWTPPWTTRHTFVGHVTAAGGWNNVTPFQLTLGGERALRGYDDWRFPGGRRVVLSAEDRYYLGWPFPDLIDLGLTAHVDAGHIWRGDVPQPYGADSGWKFSGGLGVRVNFPAGGRTTYRVDYAMPFDRGPGDGRLLISVGEVLGIDRRFDRPEITRSRMSRLSADLFNFPR